MENGAEEPEQSETSAEIRKFADLEDATTTTSPKGEEVHHVVEDVINEEGLHSNGEELTPADEITVTKVTKNDLSVSTLDSEGDSERARILEDRSDAAVDGIENASTVSSEYSTDGVKEGKEPENETGNSSSLESNDAIAVETNRNEKLPTSQDELSKESDKNENLPTSHEEFFEENLQTNELPSPAESAQNSSVTEIGHVELPTTNDKLTTEVNAADASPSAEGDIEPAPADDEQTTDEGVALETPSTTDFAAPVAVEQDSPFDSLTAIEEPTKGEPRTDELSVTPATVEPKGIEGEDVEPEEALPKENEEDEARFNQETPQAVTVVKDEASYSTKSDEANAGVENTELDPATADAELVKDETSTDEVPSSTESTEGTNEVESAPVGNQVSRDVRLSDEIPSTAESAKATTFEDEKDLAPFVATEELTVDKGLADKFPRAGSALEHDEELESAAPHVATVPDELASAPEATEADPVDNDRNVDHDEDSESTAPTDDTKLDELASTAESTEFTPVENAKKVEDFESAAPVEDKKPGELASTPESTEVTPIGDANNLNHDEDLEQVAPNDDTEPDELVPAPETTEAAPVDDVKNVERVKDLLEEESVADGNISTAPFAQTSPAVEDKGAKGQASHEELAKENTETDEAAPASELVERSPVEDANNPEPTTADEELNQDDNLADEIMLSTESAEANPAVEDRDMESVTPSEELAKDETAGELFAPVRKSPEIIPDDHATDVEPLTADELPKEEGQEGKVSTDSVEEFSAIELEDGEASIPHDELALEGTVANELGHAPEPVEDREDAEPKTVDEDRNQGNSLTNETVLPTGSAEATPVVEDRDLQPLTADELDEEKLAGEATDSNPIVDDEHVEAPTPSEELTNETVTDELSPAGNAAEFIPVDDAYDAERVSARGRLDKVEVLGDEIPSTDNLPEKVVDASTPHEELVNRLTTDEVAQIPDSHEASPVERTTDAELITGDEGVTDEDNAADAMSLISDSSDGTFVVDGEDLESPKDVEVPTSHEELAQKVIMTDESSPSPESGDTASVEDSQAEGPFAVDEVVNEDTESTPTVEDEEASTSQEELAKEGIADAAAQSPESGEATPADHAEDGEKVKNATEETPLNTNSADAIPAAEVQNVEAATFDEELTEEGTTDEVAQHPESGDATPVYDAKDEEPIITDDGVNKEKRIADETLVKTDSANAIPAVEDKVFEALTSPDELAKDVEAVPDDSGVASESGGVSSAVEDEVVDTSTPHEQLVKEETMGDESQSLDSVEGSLVDDAQDGEPVTSEREVNKESLAEEVPFTADAKDAVPVSEDKHVDVPPPHEEVAEEDTTDQAVQSLDSGDAPLVEDVKHAEPVNVDEDVNKALSTAEDVETSLTTDSDVMVPPVDEKNVEAPTSHEELVTEESVDDVYESVESVEAGPFVDAENGTGDEGSIKEENGADERPLMTDSANAIPAVGDEDVDIPTPHEELDSEETVTDDLGRASKDREAIPVENAEPVTEAENVKMEQSTIQEALTTGSAEMTNAVEGDVVEAPTPLEDVAKEDTEPNESPPALESAEVSSVVEDEDVQPMIPDVLKKDIEVPVNHEQLAQEDMVADELPSVPESPVVTPSEENREIDSATDKEEFTEDKSLPDEVTLERNSSQAIAASEAKDEESPILHQEPGGMNTATEELPSTYEVADGAPIDGDVDALSRELAVADEVPSDEPAQAVVTEAEKPAIANEELIKSEVGPTHEELCTEESEANVTDLAAEPTEMVDKHMVTADSSGKLQRNPPLTYLDDHKNGISNDAVQPVVTEESPETKEATDHTFSSVNGDKVEVREPLLEETPKLALTGEGVASDGDDILEKIVENADPAITADLGTATLDTQGHKADVVNNFHSPVSTTSTSKAIQTRDLDPGLLQEHREDPEEDTTSVPLSSHSTDLSSSWVSVPQIQDADSQCASTGSRIHVSQKSQSRRPDDELAYGRDDWRIVSEQNISALKTNDVDTGSSGTKFPFSIILWCSQSMASLFGGAKD